MPGLGRIALAALGILAYQNRDKLADLLKGANQNGGGLGELLERFRNAGKGDTVDSWVRQGPNEPIDQSSVEKAIDPETLDALARQTGMSREEIVDRLALNLPDAVNDMTPDGRLPEERQPTGEPTLLDPVPTRST